MYPALNTDPVWISGESGSQLREPLAPSLDLDAQLLGSSPDGGVLRRESLRRMSDTQATGGAIEERHVQP